MKDIKNSKFYLSKKEKHLLQKSIVDTLRPLKYLHLATTTNYTPEIESPLIKKITVTNKNTK